MPPCLTLRIIRYESRKKRSNSGKGIAPFSTTQCSSYWKRNLRVAFDYGQLTYLQIYIYIYIYIYIVRWVDCRHFGIINFVNALCLFPTLSTVQSQLGTVYEEISIMMQFTTPENQEMVCCTVDIDARSAHTRNENFKKFAVNHNG